MLKNPIFVTAYQQTAFIRAEFDKFAQDLATAKPTATPRTWSFEVETPDADRVNENLTTHYRRQTAEIVALVGENANPRNILEFCVDGSVERQDGDGGDCECSCTDCNYHDCNCDNCDQNNTNPDHDCRSSDCYQGAGTYQEIKPTEYCEGTHPKHLALLDLADLDEVEINDTCGLHIHLGSADLTPRDIANTIRVYRALERILDPIAGRAGTYYAQKNDEAQARRVQFFREGTEKYYAVNTAPHFAGHRAQTIEFRQHEGTNSTAEIRAWAMLMIRIVEFAKTNRTTLWLQEAQTFAQAWSLLNSK